MRSFALLVLFLFCVLGLKPQNQVRDSIRSALHIAKDDTSRAFAYVCLGEEIYLSHPDSALLFWEKAIGLCNSNLKKKGNSQVITRTFQNHLATALQNSGLILQDRGDIAGALENFFKALRIKEDLKVAEGIANCYLAIGGVYAVLDDSAKALSYYRKSIPRYESYGDMGGVAAAYNNIGALYHDFNDPANALLFFEKTYKIEEQIGDLAGMAYATGAIGTVYEQGDPKKALDYYRRSFKLHEELGNKYGMSLMLNNIGSAQCNLGQFSEAEKSYEYSLRLSKEINYPENIQDAARELAGLYKRQKNGMKALEMYELYITMRDTLRTQDARKAAIQKHIQYEYDKKATADSLVNLQKIAGQKIKHDEAIKQQRIYTYSGIVGFTLMLIIAVVSLRAYRNKQKANEIISRQKSTVEEQKIMIEEKQKEIIDSIMYARRIQQSLLSHEKYIDKSLKRLNPAS